MHRRRALVTVTTISSGAMWATALGLTVATVATGSESKRGEVIGALHRTALAGAVTSSVVSLLGRWSLSPGVALRAGYRLGREDARRASE